MARMLIVDDEKNIRRSLSSFFESCSHRVQIAESAEAALSLLAGDDDVDLVITDYRMAQMNGLDLLREIRHRFPHVEVILMTAYGTVENAVNAMKSGACDYITKPFSLDQIRHTVDKALEIRALRSENRDLRNTLDETPLLESKSAAMRDLIETARHAAHSNATILLTGESGTGKNVLARQIHLWSSRRNAPFVVVNCTMLSDTLLESELFGHVRGAFTDAIKDKPGRLEAADGGTVFLDEIADLPPPIQTKLLRFLQEQRFERVGDQKTIEVDARIVAASNRDLQLEVSSGRFRVDLFYRLNVITLRLPALRERPEDIIPLADRLLAAARTRNRRPNLQLSPETIAALMAYRWPGNVRELRNVVERAAVLSRGDVISKEDLPDHLFQPALVAADTASSLEEVEKEHIRRVLAQAATLEEAADRLSIGVSTLWRKRKRYQLD
jgi:NtrC-family two-component system response regulator AlgB